MPEIQNRDRFIPDKNAKQNWLGTRKRSFPCGYMTLPGFYQTVDFPTDTGWFIMAMLIEIAALIMTLYGGLVRGGGFLVGAIIAVILFVIFDYIGALWYHHRTEEKCLLKNQLLIQPNNNHVVLNDQLNRTNIRKIFGVIFLIFSAILKVLAVALLTHFGTIMFVILILFYGVVVYVHISYTGYWLAEYTTNKMIKKMHKQWIQDNAGFQNNQVQNIRYNVGEPLTRPFKSKSKLNRIEINAPKNVEWHSIVFLGENRINEIEKEYLYELRTTGILLDSQITQLCIGLEVEQQSLLAKECLTHQIQTHSL